ncbi:hypothetical protein [[Pseudomonas] boreopolis]
MLNTAHIAAVTRTAHGDAAGAGASGTTITTITTGTITPVRSVVFA